MTLNELKRGMRCTERSGLTYIVDKVEGDKICFIYPIENGYHAVSKIGNDLKSKTDYDCADIMKIEDITKDGYKTIWEREERYYLRVPEEYANGYYLNNIVKEDSFYFGDKDEIDGIYKTKFTKSEIGKLPRQDFVQSLEKELVEC